MGKKGYKRTRSFVGSEMGVRVSVWCGGSVCVGTCRAVAVWLCGCGAVWLCDCVAVWLANSLYTETNRWHTKHLNPKP